VFFFDRRFDLFVILITATDILRTIILISCKFNDKFVPYLGIIFILNLNMGMLGGNDPSKTVLWQMDILTIVWCSCIVLIG